MPAAAHVGHTGHRHSGQGEHRLGVPRPVGLQHGQGLHLLHGEKGGALDLPVDLQGGDHLLPAGVLPDHDLHSGPEGVDVLLPDGEARRQGVAAVALQEVAALLQGAEEVDPPVGPAGALALSVGLEADHEHRAGELLGQPGGHDAHHPLVPGLVRQHQAVVLPVRVQPAQALVEDIQLHRLAGAVEVAELLGQQLRLGGVLGEDEVRGGLGLAHAPRGVDPGGEAVAHGGGVDVPVQSPRLGHEGVEPPAVGLFQVAQAHPDDGAVLPQQGHHVGHGAHGGQVGVLPEELVRPVPAQGHHQLQGHPHAGQVLEGIGAVLPVGVHHCHGLGQALLALVVVGDDHVHPQGGCVGRLLHGGDAAVHGDDQGDSPLRQGPDRGRIHPVALVQPVGDVILHPGPPGAEVVGQQAGGGDPVHVIVPVDGDLLPGLQGPLHPGHRSVHVLHEEGVPELIRAAGQKGPGLGQILHPPGAQSRRHQGGHALIPEGPIGPVGPCCDVPLLVFHGRSSAIL